MKKFKYIPVFLLFPVLSTFSQYLPTGSQAVDFSARTEAGEDFTLSGLKGKYVLLDFTGTACAPCWDAYPHLTEVQEKFKDRLQVVTFHVWDTAKVMWERIALGKNIQVNWIRVWDAEIMQTVSKQYKVDGIPLYYLIDPEGKVLTAWFGYRRKKLDRELNKYLVTKN